MTRAGSCATCAFAWIPGDNFMPAAPANIMSPAGWQEIVSIGGPSGGFAIQWTASTPGDELVSGSSLSGFSFDSTLTLAQLQAPAAGDPSDPVDTFFVYASAPFTDPGFQSTPTIASSATPEPGTFVLTTCGLLALTIALRRRQISE
jgi:hypothetical protein